MTREEILKKGFFGERRFLSNYHFIIINYNGLRVPTAEHAYQMSKATNTNDKLWVAYQPTPAQAKKEGSKIKCREDWEDIKVDLMKDICRIKFRDPELRKLLLATGDDELIEYNWWKDSFWGICEGKGKNMLGKILMEIRNEIKTSEPNELGKLLTK